MSDLIVGRQLCCADVGIKPMNDPVPGPSRAAERMRRHRERRRDGLRCLTIELRETEVNSLIQKAPLKSDARNDNNAVRDALYAHLDQTLGLDA
jgi:hypothetical protein